MPGPTHTPSDTWLYPSHSYPSPQPSDNWIDPFSVTCSWRFSSRNNNSLWNMVFVCQTALEVLHKRDGAVGLCLDFPWQFEGGTYSCSLYWNSSYSTTLLYGEINCNKKKTIQRKQSAQHADTAKDHLGDYPSTFSCIRVLSVQDLSSYLSYHHSTTHQPYTHLLFLSKYKNNNHVSLCLSLRPTHTLYYIQNLRKQN
jgi:hypothetical protein